MSELGESYQLAYSEVYEHYANEQPQEQASKVAVGVAREFHEYSSGFVGQCVHGYGEIELLLFRGRGSALGVEGGEDGEHSLGIVCLELYESLVVYEVEGGGAAYVVDFVDFGSRAHGP